MTKLLYKHDFHILRKRNSPEKCKSNCSQRRKEEFCIKQCPIRMKRQLGYMVHTIHCRSVRLCMHAQSDQMSCHLLCILHNRCHVKWVSATTQWCTQTLGGEKRASRCLQRVTLNKQLLTADNQHVMKCHAGARARLRKDP
jgi:hypothetical protein